MSVPQTFPNAQAVEGGLAVERFAALAADMRRKLRPIARTSKHFVRAEAIRYLEVIDGREAFIAANPSAADVCAERALTRLGPNGLGPAINGFTRYHGEQ